MVMWSFASRRRWTRGQCPRISRTPVPENPEGPWTPGNGGETTESIASVSTGRNTSAANDAPRVAALFVACLSQEDSYVSSEMDHSHLYRACLWRQRCLCRVGAFPQLQRQ